MAYSRDNPINNGHPHYGMILQFVLVRVECLLPLSIHDRLPDEVRHIVESRIATEEDVGSMLGRIRTVPDEHLMAALKPAAICPDEAIKRSIG